METHHFKVDCTWEGGSKGHGNVNGGDRFNVNTIVPPEFGGPGGAASPEDLLLASVASCIAITAAWACEIKKIPLQKIEITVAGDVTRDPATRQLRFSSITLELTMIAEAGATDEQHQALKQAAIDAKKRCIISNSLRPDIEFHIKPTVLTGNPQG